MPENFCVSLICRKPLSSKSINWLKIVGISIGENYIKYFGDRKVFVYEIERNEVDDFQEVVIAVPELVFHKDKFQIEIKPLISFLNECFFRNQDLIYALCSYEINGYVLSNVNKLEDFGDDKLLKKFPIVCLRDTADNDNIKVNYNFEAQDIFL